MNEQGRHPPKIRLPSKFRLDDHLDVKRVITLFPMEFPLSVVIFLVAVVFTIFPEELSHTATSFETRGIIHHVWHYMLLIGSGTVFVSLFMRGNRSLVVGLIGRTTLLSAMVLGTTAILVAAFDPDVQPVNGLDVALRLGFIGGLMVRLWITTTRPIITVTTTEATKD